MTWYNVFYVVFALHDALFTLHWTDYCKDPFLAQQYIYISFPLEVQVIL